MKQSYYELIKAYRQVRAKEKAAREDCAKRPERDDWLIWSRSMAALYVAAQLCRYDRDSFWFDFKVYLYIAEAYAFREWHDPALTSLFLKIALCDAAFAVAWIPPLLPEFQCEAVSADAHTLAPSLVKLLDCLQNDGNTRYAAMLRNSAANTGEIFLGKTGGIS